jgi:VanZ family protein
MTPPRTDRRSAFIAFLAYLGFVVYGSLVPFQYRATTLDEALRQFAAIPYLNLGLESRADWIANIVLYVPLAFLGCAGTVGLRSLNPLRHLGVLLVCGFCLAVAVAVEFTQIFFAPRTVSLNDLLAEGLGSLGGGALFVLGRRQIAQMRDSIALGGRGSVAAAGLAYLALYCVLSLFPYDFVVSWEELELRLDAGQWGWLIAGDCSGLGCVARQTGEVAALAPAGLFAALALPRLGYRRLFMAGLALGVVLEALQLLTASGVSQGLSILLRGVGLVAGAALGQALIEHGPEFLERIIRRALPFVALPYLLAGAALNGWFQQAWLPTAEAWARLGEVRLLPFYYHYYSTESSAMTSLLAVAGLYAPLGLAAWSLRPVARGGQWVAALWAALLAMVFESGKLWIAAKHPDPTDILIAVASAVLVRSMAAWLARSLRPGGTPPSVQPSPSPAEPINRPAFSAALEWPKPLPADMAASGVFALLVLLGLAWNPAGTFWLTGGLLAYGGVLWLRPSLLFFALPLLLPTLDFRPLTGDLLLDPFDLAVLVALAVGYWRTSQLPATSWPSHGLPAVYALLWASWIASSLRGLWPLTMPIAGLPESSHSLLATWQTGKGLLWALLLVPLLRRVPSENAPSILNRLLSGVVAGLTLEILAVLWERQRFVGFGDFENVFRVTGTFADMRTGGAYIEAFLAFGFPALAAWTLATRDGRLKAAGILAAGLGGYAMLVTFSRGGYAGLVAGLLPVAWCALRQPSSAAPYRRWALAGVAAAVTLAAVPVLSGGFAQERLGRSAADLDIRLNHWQRALGLMDDGPVAALAGMGFGQYPLLYLLRAESGAPPATYSVWREDSNSFLRLGAGESAFLEQTVDARPGEHYTLTARIRRSPGPAVLGVALCEKALLYSFDCAWLKLESTQKQPQWTAVRLDIPASSLGGELRPVKLSLHTPESGAPVDVDDISLRAADGRELLVNGDFERGAARWLFATDQDLAWHIHEMALEVYLAQGLLGLAGMAGLLAAVGKNLRPAIAAGKLEAAGLAGGLAGLLTVGILGSVMDSARLSMLFYLGAFAAALLARHKQASIKR